MPYREVNLPEIGKIKLYKKSGVRTMRMTVHPDHYIRVTIPKWLPYRVGLDFVMSKKTWIDKHKTNERMLVNNQAVGKRHYLIFEAAPVNKTTSRVTGGQIKVRYPIGDDLYKPAVQAAALQACLRALKQEASELLPTRLDYLSKQTGLSYASVSVKKLKARWGSCSPKRHITLSVYLMELPWELIDYVILHELIHTKHLNHGVDFWHEFARHAAEPKQYRRKLRAYRPSLPANVA